MINAGAILICSLLKTLVGPEMTSAEKFDFTMNYFEVTFYYCYDTSDLYSKADNNLNCINEIIKYFRD